MNKMAVRRPRRHTTGARQPCGGSYVRRRTSHVGRLLTFAHSPDPDDAYMFYGFATGAVTIPGHVIKHHLEDIQSLNEHALKGEFEITAVSAHAYAHLTDRYWVLSCGASVGRRYGPILVTNGHKKASSPAAVSGGSIKMDPGSPQDRRPSATRQAESVWCVALGPPDVWRAGFRRDDMRIAIPGKWTTAALVLDLWLAEEGRRVERVVMPFDRILEAVEKGVVDAGLIIHEGQLTYHQQGLHKLWDAGQWWHQKTGLPLPLGLDVVRSDLGLSLAKEISVALRASIEYANTHREEAIAYALRFGRGLDTDLAQRFVGMYVNDDTLNQGQDVQEGLKTLYALAHQRGLIPQPPAVRFI